MIDKNNIPKHVAIIMDGNGRWAKKRGLPRTAGHRKGIERIKEIIEVAKETGIKVLTFFAFSTENWQRPKKEVDMLMHSLDNFLKKRVDELNKNDIRLIVIGRKEPIPKYLQKRIEKVMALTQHNHSLIVNLALNYGARAEIVDATKKILEEVLTSRLKMDELTESKFSQFLYTHDLPDPDLLIRTSGEMRLSNFLLWQLSYSELYFCRKFWPDFEKKDFLRAIQIYKKRERRFGGLTIDAQKKDN